MLPPRERFRQESQSPESKHATKMTTLYWKNASASLSYATFDRSDLVTVHSRPRANLGERCDRSRACPNPAEHLPARHSPAARRPNGPGARGKIHLVKT